MVLVFRFPLMSVMVAVMVMVASASVGFGVAVASLIMGGVSVTCTLPYGTPRDVKRELDWLVESGPRTGLFLGASSSITPGVPWENVKALVEGLAYYRAGG